jgi:hypothetical protein
MKLLEKQATAYKLKLHGKQYDEIANALGYAGPSGAFQAVESFRKRIIRDEPAHLRDEMVDLLDYILSDFVTGAKQGIKGHAEIVLKINDQKAKLLGAYPAEKVDLTLDKPIIVKEVVVHVDEDE